MLSHTREWMTNPGARCPPGPVLEQLTAPTPGGRQALHSASALTEQLTDEVLDLALEQLRVLYPQTHIPPAGTSNRLGRLGLQRRVEAAHPGGVVEQWLTLHNPSTAQGHWYLHQLLFLPRTAPPRLLGQVPFPKGSHITFPGASMIFLICMPLTLCTTYNKTDDSNSFLVIFHPMSDNFEPNQLSRVVAPHCGAMRWAISNF